MAELFTFLHQLRQLLVLLLAQGSPDIKMRKNLWIVLATVEVQPLILDLLVGVCASAPPVHSARAFRSVLFATISHSLTNTDSSE